MPFTPSDEITPKQLSDLAHKYKDWQPKSKTYADMVSDSSNK